MAILQSSDLLVVYKPETGFVSTLLKDNINFSDLVNDTGEAYSVGTTPENSVLQDDNSTLDTDSVGQGLTVNIKVRTGVILEMYVVASGFGYLVGELVRVDGGDQVIKVDSINEVGGVTASSLYSGEGGYSITSGLLTDFPFGYHETLMNVEPPLEGGESTGNFVDIKVEASQVIGSFVGAKTFDSDTEFGGDKFKVGEGVHILANKTRGGVHIESNVQSVLEVESGGPVKFSAESLQSDVKSWALEVVPEIDVVIQENDGTQNHGGGLGYNINTGELTYVRSYNPEPTETSVNLDVSYGNIIDENGTYTSSLISSQKDLNAQLLQRIQFLESVIYQASSSNDLLKDSVTLKDGAQAYNGYEDPETGFKGRSRIATSNDITRVESIANEAAEGSFIGVSLFNALETSTTFEEFKSTVFTDD
jgi:hypothetical protein